MIVAITLVWVLFAVLITWGLLNGQKRDRDLGTVALERLISAQRSRLSMALRRVEQDLREEAAYVAAHDSTSDAMLQERWLPLLESDWVITSIGLANEAGEEQRLGRANGDWRYATTVGGEVNGPPLVTEWPVHGDLSSSRVSIGEGGHDPRRTLWFGQALEDHATGATWSTSVTPDSTEELNASILIRSDRPDKPYRVIRFSLSPQLLVRSLGEGSTSYGALYLGPEGRSWNLPDTGELSLALLTAHAMWRTDRHEDPLFFTTDGIDRMAQVVPLALTGTRIRYGDALWSGIATHTTKAEYLPGLIQRMSALVAGVGPGGAKTEIIEFQPMGEATACRVLRGASLGARDSLARLHKFLRGAGPFIDHRPAVTPNQG